MKEQQAFIYDRPRPGQKLRRTQQAPQDRQVDDLEEDDEYYVTRAPTSTRRYAISDEDVYQRGNQRIHVRQVEIPRRRQVTAPPPKVSHSLEVRRLHWMLWIGLALFIMIAGYIAVSALGSWWQHHQDDATYGNPRTFQIDAVVGHGDSNSQPSHFIAINLKGQVIVAELPGGDVTKAISYQITTVPGNDSNPPVTLKFTDLNGDGKIDMEILIGDSPNSVTMFLFNNGSKFVSKL